MSVAANCRQRHVYVLEFKVIHDFARGNSGTVMAYTCKEENIVSIINVHTGEMHNCLLK